MRNIIYIISFLFILSCESDNTSNNIVYDNSLEKFLQLISHIIPKLLI